jgi:heme exporter protein A
LSAPFPASGLCLKVDNLGLERGGRSLIQGLGFELASGQALLVRGANGAGKTTLLRTLAGLLPLQSGQIHFSGSAWEQECSLAVQSHYVGHAEALKGALSAKENLEFWALMLGGSAGAGLSCTAALESLAIRHALDIPAAYLSAGQKRRLALARLLVAPRPLWILDEPFTALDQQAQSQLRKMIEEHLAQGGLMIASTHVALGLAGTRELYLGERS